MNSILSSLLMFLCFAVHTSRGRRTLNKPVSCDIVKPFDLSSCDNDSAIRNESEVRSGSM